VGRPVAGVDVGVIAISDQPISSLAPGSLLPSGEVGEIIVRGPVVTREYDALPEATAAAKIPDAERPGGVWHRMGDCGLLDADGRLWFVGRKAERVVTKSGTLFTEPCEQVFRAHPRARRCALVGVDSETVLEGLEDALRLSGELGTLGRRHPHTAAVKSFYFRAHLPVDVRHNAKIHRLALAKWAASAKAYRAD
jgi:acyl-CoA synthetase (AMP-forming)/AMP-acid ligase II